MKTVTNRNGRRVAVGGSPAPVRDRTIPAAELWLALADSERNSISGSGSQKAKAFVNTLAIVREWPRSEVRQTLNQLEAAGLLTAGRADTIFDAIR